MGYNRASNTMAYTAHKVGDTVYLNPEWTKEKDITHNKGYKVVDTQLYELNRRDILIVDDAGSNRWFPNWKFRQ